jgi:hypothetical protein
MAIRCVRDNRANDHFAIGSENHINRRTRLAGQKHKWSSAVCENIISFSKITAARHRCTVRRNARGSRPAAPGHSTTVTSETMAPARSTDANTDAKAGPYHPCLLMMQAIWQTKAKLSGI